MEDHCSDAPRVWKLKDDEVIMFISYAGSVRGLEILEHLEFH